MSKAVLIIATILISVVLASRAIEDTHRPHKHHKRQHSQFVGQHNGHPADHSRHHLRDLNKEKINHGQMPVPLAPHHSKAQRNGGRHRASKSSKPSRNHHQQSKPTHHKARQAQKSHGHGNARKHH